MLKSPSKVEQQKTNFHNSTGSKCQINIRSKKKKCRFFPKCHGHSIYIFVVSSMAPKTNEGLQPSTIILPSSIGASKRRSGPFCTAKRPTKRNMGSMTSKPWCCSVEVGSMVPLPITRSVGKAVDLNLIR